MTTHTASASTTTTLEELHRTAIDTVQVDDEMIERYLEYPCSYRMCKYKGPFQKTWGELIKDDRQHFVFLLSSEVSPTSNTFLALSSFLTPSELSLALSCVRRRDTKEGRKEEQMYFLALECTHKGRMNGKTWQAIRTRDYSYFVWAVANTMNRDTKSFKVFFECLNPKEQTLVLSGEKGQIKVPKGLQYSN